MQWLKCAQCVYLKEINRLSNVFSNCLVSIMLGLYTSVSWCLFCVISITTHKKMFTTIKTTPPSSANTCMRWEGAEPPIILQASPLRFSAKRAIDCPESRCTHIKTWRWNFPTEMDGRGEVFYDLRHETILKIDVQIFYGHIMF